MLVRLTDDYGRSQPDVLHDLIEPVAVDFTANGWMGAKDLKGYSPCIVIMQVRNGAFTRVHPTAKGTLDCTADNVMTVTMDPAEEAKSIR